jgi:urease accessory protein
LSGFGHPVIELDHLVFLLGTGVAAALARMPTRRMAMLVPVYVIAAALGTAVRWPGVEIAWGEPAVAASVLVVALWLWSLRVPGVLVAVAFGILAGFAHGYAFGEAVIGAEPTPLGAYLLGLALVQAGMLMAAWAVTRRAALVMPSMVFVASRVLAAGAAVVAFWSGIGFLA